MDLNYNIIIRKKDNGLQYIISYKDKIGKWKQKSKQGFEDSRKGKIACKEAAEKAVENLKKEIVLDLNKEHEEITFKEYTEMFLDHQKLYKEENTIDVYKSAFIAFNQLNDFELKKITSLHIQKCVDDMIKKQLSASSIQTYVTKINTAFKLAFSNYKIIASNPVANIIVPKNKKENVKIALTKSELDMLLSKLKSRKYFLIALIASKCGLRIGEIIGLTWNDINNTDRIINVKQQWKKLNTGDYGFGDLKGTNSYREVPAPAIVLKELAKYDKEMPRNIDNRIFDYTNTRAIGNHLSETFRNLGFDISIHELRHTYATMLISNGLDFKTVAQLMGHDIKETMATYSHVTSDMLENASKIINSIF